MKIFFIDLIILLTIFTIFGTILSSLIIDWLDDKKLEKNMKGSGKKRGQDKGKSAPGEILFAGLSELKEHYPMPSAFEAYMPEV